jgi:hypothetical protein
MGFSIFCILEACLLIANALAILNERFLRQSKFLSPNWELVGFHVDNIN